MSHSGAAGLARRVSITNKPDEGTTMKKFIAIWIGCLLALASVARGQQDETQPTPAKKHPRKERAGQTSQPSPSQSSQRGPAARPQPGRRARERAPENAQPPANPARPNAKTNPRNRAKQRQNRQERQATRESGNPEQAPTAAPNRPTPQTNATTGTAAQPNQTKAGARQRNVQGAKADVQKIKKQHANFRAQPKPEKVPTVSYQANYRIENSQRWQGPQYVAFRNYRPQWRDRSWYHSHYTRIVLIAGGYYYFDNGYWYPAWGYAPGQQYYAYNGPIYAGREAEPPDRVIADVQAELQQMGYYKGEVDGLLGPLTREALSQYQTDNGLYATEAIDQPTLASLGLT